MFSDDPKCVGYQIVHRGKKKDYIGYVYFRDVKRVALVDQCSEEEARKSLEKTVQEHLFKKSKHDDLLPTPAAL